MIQIIYVLYASEMHAHLSLIDLSLSPPVTARSQGEMFPISEPNIFSYTHQPSRNAFDDIGNSVFSGQSTLSAPLTDINAIITPMQTDESYSITRKFMGADRMTVEYS
jgi:hypothetical protein